MVLAEEHLLRVPMVRSGCGERPWNTLCCTTTPSTMRRTFGLASFNTRQHTSKAIRMLRYPTRPTPFMATLTGPIAQQVELIIALARGERGLSTLATSISMGLGCTTSSSESRGVSMRLLVFRNHIGSTNKTPGAISALLVKHLKRVKRGSPSSRPGPPRSMSGACPQKEVRTPELRPL